MNLRDYLATAKLTQAEFAAQLGITQGMVWQWLSGRSPIAAERCIDVERVTGGAVRCEELRPDVDWAVLRSPAGAITSKAEA